MAESSKSDPVSMLAGAWDDALLHHIADLNEHFLGVLQRSLARPGAVARCGLLAPLRAQWHQLDAARLRLLAECPYLLLDAGFSLPECWKAQAGTVVNDAPAAGRGVLFDDPAGAELGRRALILGWHLAQANPFAARIALGMSARCTGLIAASRLQDLEQLVSVRPHWMRPRWDDRPQVWRQLLQAAIEGPVSRLRLLQLRGLQLLAGGMLAETG
jgi:hypothetical protein